MMPVFENKLCTLKWTDTPQNGQVVHSEVDKHTVEVISTAMPVLVNKLVDEIRK